MTDSLLSLVFSSCLGCLYYYTRSSRLLILRYFYLPINTTLSIAMDRKEDEVFIRTQPNPVVEDVEVDDESTVQLPQEEVAGGATTALVFFVIKFLILSSFIQ